MCVYKDHISLWEKQLKLLIINDQFISKTSENEKYKYRSN